MLSGAASVLLLTGASPPTAVDAEQDFARIAQTRGQWTAFRATAADDAVLFVPEAVNAQIWLKDRADPPISVMWWPAKSFVSCDGQLAHNSGPWVRNGGTLKGYFSTVWARQADGSWRWLYDHGDVTDEPQPAGEKPTVKRASCADISRAKVKAQTWLENFPPELLKKAGTVTNVGAGASPDGTLLWLVYGFSDAKHEQMKKLNGTYEATILLWDGRHHMPVHKDLTNYPKS